MNIVNVPVLAAGGVDLWYALPLVVVVSLVYSATRYERMNQIIPGALRFGGWVGGFMLVIFVLLFAVTWGL